ncbi:MAG: hypothetical protein ACYCSG_05140 [Thermoplasmataceae archaeon]
MSYKGKLFSIFLIFILFIAGMAFSISYTGEKIKKLANPYAFIPENSTFLLYTQQNGEKILTFGINGNTAAITDFPANQQNSFFFASPFSINTTVDISFISSIDGNPVYEINTIPNRENSTINNGSSQAEAVGNIFSGEPFYFTNPFPSIYIIGSLPAVEASILAYTTDSGKTSPMTNFLNLNDNFSAFYYFGGNFPIKSISVNLTGESLFINTVFSKSVNIIKLYFVLLGVLPSYITVYTPAKSEITIKIPFKTSPFASAIDYILSILVHE